MLAALALVLSLPSPGLSAGTVIYVAGKPVVGVRLFGTPAGECCFDSWRPIPVSLGATNRRGQVSVDGSSAPLFALDPSGNLSIWSREWAGGKLALQSPLDLHLHFTDGSRPYAHRKVQLYPDRWLYEYKSLFLSLVPPLAKKLEGTTDDLGNLALGGLPKGVPLFVSLDIGQRGFDYIFSKAVTPGATYDLLLPHAILCVSKSPSVVGNEGRFVRTTPCLQVDPSPGRAKAIGTANAFCSFGG